MKPLLWRKEHLLLHYRFHGRKQIFESGNAVIRHDLFVSLCARGRGEENGFYSQLMGTVDIAIHVVADEYYFAGCKSELIQCQLDHPRVRFPKPIVCRDDPNPIG